MNILPILKSVGSSLVGALLTKQFVFWAIRKVWTERTDNKADDAFIDLSEAALNQDKEAIIKHAKELGLELVAAWEEKQNKDK